MVEIPGAEEFAVSALDEELRSALPSPPPDAQSMSPGRPSSSVLAHASRCTDPIRPGPKPRRRRSWRSLVTPPTDEAPASTCRRELEVVGWFGGVHPQVRKKLGIDGPVFAVDLDRTCARTALR